MSVQDNPNPTVGLIKRSAGARPGYNADVDNPHAAMKEMLAERYTHDVYDGVNSFIAKVLTSPTKNALDENNKDPISVRCRVKGMHDYLPIPQGPAQWTTPLGKKNLLKIGLHPVYTSQQKARFAKLEEGDDVVVSHVQKKTPWEYGNGILQSNYAAGISIAGLKPSEEFRICADYIAPSGIVPGSGAPGAGSQGGRKKATFGGFSEAQTKAACGKIFSVGNIVKTPAAYIPSQELINFVKKKEAFISTVLAGYDAGHDAVGYGLTLTSERNKRLLLYVLHDGSPQGAKTIGTNPGAKKSYLWVQTNPDTTQIKAAPKATTWGANGKRNFKWKEAVPNTLYSAISEPQAASLLASYLQNITAEEVRTSAGKDLASKFTQNQMDALVSMGYNTGPKGPASIIRVIKKGGSKFEIHAKFLEWIYSEGKRNRGLMKRRRIEADWFFGKVPK